MLNGREKRVTRRDLLRAGVVLAAGGVLAACQGATATPAPTGQAVPTPTASTTVSTEAVKRGGNLVMGTVGDIANLDPYFMNFNNYPMMETVYDQFARMTNDLKLEPAVIEEWTPSEDSLRLTLKVRSGVKFHDGTVATPDDVVKCIERGMDEKEGGHVYQQWNVVSEAIAKGNDIVEVTLKEPKAYLLQSLAFISLIQPKAFANLKSTEGGSGPFKVKEWLPSDYLDMERWPEYWRTGQPYLDGVRTKFFADAGAMVAALEGGVIDAAMSVPPSEYERLQQKVKMVKGQDAANFYHFTMNTKHALFDNKEVRQAIAFAIDKESMCRNVLFGVSDPIELAWPRSSIAYLPELEGMYRYDLDEAKRRLADAGYPDGIEFKCQFSTAYGEFMGFAEILAASLAQIGCKMELVPMDPAAYTDLAFQQDGPGYQSTFSFAGGTQWFPTRIVASSMYRLKDNVCWPNGEPPKDWVDGITQADSSFDVEVQKEGMKKAVTCMMDEMWSMPLAFRYTLFGLQPYVEGFGFGVYDQPRYHEVTLNK